MIRLFNISSAGNLTKEEADSLIPVLNRISARTKSRLSKLNSQLSSNSLRNIELQDSINNELQSWSDNMRRLGVIPVSLCKVRIPVDGTHYMWEYPSRRLEE